ncbi:UNKNOWN [Stylonychia lemnae]|uniref:Uncharacterized protein n=1 Tax=Stylonychia lemnae TaxID=5949 RepID=A0A078B557_STYLE|nr:UNKNOWN [Stylonychia lemnae]|eukprot:CDW89559.1 UNKNOWN [Stylonychia lemnae]
MSDDIVTELLQTIDSQKVQLDQLNEENKNLKNENAELKQNVEELTGEIYDLKVKYEGIINDITQNDISSPPPNQNINEDGQQQQLNQQQIEESKCVQLDQQEQQEQKLNLDQLANAINSLEQKQYEDEEMKDESEGLFGDIPEMQKQMIELTLSYQSNSDIHEDEDILIMGEFNNWLPDIMQRLTNQIFLYKVDVLAGYRYRYQFIVNGDITIDTNQEFSESKLGRQTNFKYAIKNPLNQPMIASELTPQVLQKLPSFVHPEMKKLYQKEFYNLQKQNTLMKDVSVRIGSTLIQEEEDKVEQLEDTERKEKLYKYMQRNKYLIQKLNRLREMLNLAEAASEKEGIALTKEQMKGSDEEYQIITSNIRALIKGRYVYSLDDTPINYAIREYKGDTNEILLRRVYDKSGVLLDDKQGLVVNLVSTNEDTFFTKYSLYNLEDENNFKRDMLNTKEHVFTVKYQLMQIDDQMECMPLEVYPTGVQIQDYDIRFNKQAEAITQVINKEFGQVKFQSFRIDQECGYVRGSVTKIYTCEYLANVLNIIHVHVNDTSDEVSIEVDYMDDEQTIKDFEEFKTDVNGQILRYKVLVRDQCINSLLYNGGFGVIEEIPFKEIRMKKDSVMEVKPKIGVEYSTEVMLVEIAKIPICMMASLDKKVINSIVQDFPKHSMNGFCADRCFERLPGYIDINVLSADNCQTLAQGETKIAIPICLLQEASDSLLAKYRQLLDDKKAQESDNISTVLGKIEIVMKHFEDNYNDLKNDLDKMQESLSQLQNQENDLENMVESMKNSEDISQEVQMKMRLITNKSSAVQRRIAAEVRMLKLRSR